MRLRHLIPLLFGKQATKYYVVDTLYQNVVSEWGTEEEAKKAALARPYSKVVTQLPSKED